MGCVWLQKAPGVLGMGSLTFPLLGGPRKVYLESAYITACHNHDPKGCRNFRGESGRRDSWAGPGTPQTAHTCPRGRGGRPKGYVCSLLASTQGRTLSSGWGLWEAENGHRLPSEASRPASPCPPQGRLRKPLPRVPLHHLGKQTLGKAVPPTHTPPVQHTLGLNRQDPSHIPQHPIISIQAPVTDKCWCVPGV